MNDKRMKGIIIIAVMSVFICTGKYLNSEAKAYEVSSTLPSVQNETGATQGETTGVIKESATIPVTETVKITVNDPVVKKGYVKNKPSLIWKKNKAITGYEIWIANKKNGKYKKVFTTTKYSYNLNKLERGKLYYVKVVAYKKVDGTIYKSKKKTARIKVLTNVKFKKSASVFAGTITLNWRTSKNVTGYCIQYSANKKFKNAKKIKISDNATDSVTIDGLKQNKNYYVRICTYKASGKNKIYSLWSAAKSVKAADAFKIINGEFRDTDGFFKNSVFIGDSVLQGFQIYVNSKGSGYLDHVKVTGVVSYSLIAATQENSKYHPLYKGKHIPPEKYVKVLGAKKVFLSFGINDIQNTGNPSYTYDKYKELINNIRKVNPDVKIYILSTTPPMKGSKNYVNYAKNLRALNELMKKYCDSTDCDYIDIASYLQTTDGYLRSDLCSDKFVHQTIAAYAIWDKVLRTYAWYYNH